MRAIYESQVVRRNIGIVPGTNFWGKFFGLQGRKSFESLMKSHVREMGKCVHEEPLMSMTRTASGASRLLSEELSLHMHLKCPFLLLTKDNVTTIY